MNDEKTAGRERCQLQKAKGMEAWCSRDKCIYWRLLEVQDLETSNELGCGLQFYQLIDGLDPDMADWLIKIKKRLENTTPEAGKSRITFKVREEE